MSELYYDFHTHNNSSDSEIIKMVCVRPGESTSCPFAAAIHPWDTAGPDIEKQLNILERQASILSAVGETGLDRLHGASLSQQIEIFQRHLNIAAAHNLSVIIHNVKCTHEILGMVATPQLTLWHRAPVRSTNLQAIVASGALVSFRATELGQVDSSLVPLEQLGLETDNSADDIRKTYEIASTIWNLPVSELKKHLAANFRRIFSFNYE